MGIPLIFTLAQHYQTIQYKYIEWATMAVQDRP